jgi:hypothetical protein
MSVSNELIRAIVDEDFVTAKQMTNDLLYMSISDKIDDVKQEVAAELFNGCDECDDEQVNEMKDYDKDGQVEAPKDEVLGSRINAAVKSGKMSPAQAARTKNKGMFR